MRILQPSDAINGLEANMLAFAQLKGNLSLIERESVKHGNELIAVRGQGKQLGKLVYTALGDMALYSKGNLSLAMSSHNLILEHYAQIQEQHYGHPRSGEYIHDSQEVKGVLQAPTTLTVNHGRIRLEGDEKEYGYIRIFTNGDNGFNSNEATIVGRIVGENGLKVLNSQGIDVMKAYFLREEYVSQMLESQKLSAIARPCSLGGLHEKSPFEAHRTQGSVLLVRDINPYTQEGGVSTAKTVELLRHLLTAGNTFLSQS